MCGFVGFTGTLENKDKVVANMLNKIIHRGPDSHNSYLDNDVAL